jgi:transcriptional regulator with XRE-family HTH domain
MARTFASPRHSALMAFLRKKREKADLTQTQVAKRLGRYQSYVTDYERGQKRIDAVELVHIAEAIGFDPLEAMRLIKRTK